MNSIKENISLYKTRRIAVLALKNAIRLHVDSILLYKKKSFASALQLSILSLEELGKAKELENYYFYSSIDKSQLSPEEEEKYLKLYYSHPWKQGAALKRDLFEYSPFFIKFIDEKKMEAQKQKATYVGLPLKNGKINYKSRILSPFMIKENEAKRHISLINDIIIEMCHYNSILDGFFDIAEMDKLINKKLHIRLKNIWDYKSRIKSSRWNNIWARKFKNT